MLKKKLFVEIKYQVTIKWAREKLRMNTNFGDQKSAKDFTQDKIKLF